VAASESRDQTLIIAYKLSILIREAKSMKSFVKIIYSSAGKFPSEIEAILTSAKFTRVNGTNTFETEVPDEEQALASINALHEVLKGQGVIYEPGFRRGNEAAGPQGGYKERMAKWKDAGLDTEELFDLLKYDVDRFKDRGLEMMRGQLDRVAAEREHEIHEVEAKEKVERAKERLMTAIASEGGQTFSQLALITGLDEDMLTQMLDELVKKGRVAARQSGRRVAYVAI